MVGTVWNGDRLSLVALRGRLRRRLRLSQGPDVLAQGSNLGFQEMPVVALRDPQAYQPEGKKQAERDAEGGLFIGDA